MTTLAELQQQFQSFLFGWDRRIEGLTVGTKQLPVRERLAVYSDAYRLRLIEVLADDFPGLRGVVGDEEFEILARAYIDACPSTHPSVRWFGHHLAGFLREAAAYRDQPALAEMAAFEWAQGEVMDAADSPALDVEDLGAIDPGTWPAMGIVFQNALRRLDLEWNVPAAWKALQDDEIPPPLTRNEKPVPWLLWRKGLEVHWRSLEDHERLALDAARDGAAFGAVCEELLAHTHDDQVPVIAAGFLKRWAMDELIARLET